MSAIDFSDAVGWPAEATRVYPTEQDARRKWQLYPERYREAIETKRRRDAARMQLVRIERAEANRAYFAQWAERNRQRVRSHNARKSRELSILRAADRLAKGAA